VTAVADWTDVCADACSGIVEVEVVLVVVVRLIGEVVENRW
jgi:hypothetical protein